MKNNKINFLALPLALAFTISVAADMTLEEVVVTAQKTESSLQDTPIAITAITEGTIFEVSSQHFDSDSYRVWKGDTLK